MRRVVSSHVVPSLIWFTALAGAQTAAANVPTNACATVPSTNVPGAEDSVVYSNHQYGFTLTLPSDWRGFHVLVCKWEGQKGERLEEESGPLLLIRHPLYTEADPREDFPIMVFTRGQWREVSDSNLDSALIVSAAPFPPGEIGRNRRYVFAFPPRFLNDVLDGFDEVSTILHGSPLHPALITPHSQTASAIQVRIRSKRYNPRNGTAQK
jgi:hypothetical protein